MLARLVLTRASAVLAPRAASAFVPIAQRAFSASAFVRADRASDKELVKKLKEELQYEKDEVKQNFSDAFIKEFKEKGLFKIEDKVGEKEVTLVRESGNEKISVIFSTDSLSDTLADEEGDGEEISSADVTIIVEKSTGGTDHGALEISATVNDNSFFIDSVAYSGSSSSMLDQTAEGDWQRRGHYGGPVFRDLDDDLQDHFHNFLAERGFDESLAEFIINYTEYKEQNEYTRWLSNVADWVQK